MKKHKWIANAMLALAALIWGIAFVAQNVGMDYVGPLTFNGIRSMIAGVALIPVAMLSGRGQAAPTSEGKRQMLRGGALCALALFAGSTLQQYGLVETTSGKSGFITAWYIVLVPLMGMLLGRRPKAYVWAAVALALVGLFLLCMNGDYSIGRGEYLTLLCAVAFAVHILLIDHFSRAVNPVWLSCVQFLLTGMISLAAMFLFEKPQGAAILRAWQPILYAGLCSGAIGYTLQMVAQKHADPATASLILSLESVFAALAGFVLLGETMTAREGVGCALVFLAAAAGPVHAMLQARRHDKTGG